MNNNFDNITKKIQDFRDKREWRKYHNPKDLAMAVSVESNELLENFLWKDIHKSEDLSSKEKQQIKEEVADIFIYLMYFCSEMDIDLIKSTSDKIMLNEAKYPIGMAKGSNKKYTEFP